MVIYQGDGTEFNKCNVPLRTGPPTKEELLVHYPAKFTWKQLKTFVNSGFAMSLVELDSNFDEKYRDLGLLKRDRTLQKRYDQWAFGIQAQYGSMVNYLINHRLRWGQRDTLSLLGSSIVEEGEDTRNGQAGQQSDPPAYFSWETPRRYLSIIQNDWPYSVPPEVEHTLIWTKIPIYHPELVDESVKARIHQDGLWGFTGNDTPPPSPSNLPSCLPALAEWGITKDKMIKSEPPTEREAKLIQRAGSEVHRFVENRWPQIDWETVWFVNPPRLQSVPGLAHVHVFARPKK